MRVALCHASILCSLSAVILYSIARVDARLWDGGERLRLGVSEIPYFQRISGAACLSAALALGYFLVVARRPDSAAPTRLLTGLTLTVSILFCWLSFLYP